MEEILEEALGMEVEEEGEGEEGDVNLRALGFIEFLTQDYEPIGTTLIDASNAFNDLSRLVMLLTVRHCWPEGARFAFNYYMHYAQFLLRQPGEPPVIILIREGVTQGDPYKWYFIQ